MPLSAAQLAQIKADNAALTTDLGQLTVHVTNPANAVRVQTAVTASTKLTTDINALVADGPPPPPPLSITTTSLPGGTVGVPYSAQLAATGGTAPYSWSSAGLPPGLALSASGAISGTPTAAGTGPVSLKVTDSSTPQLTASAAPNLGIAVPAPIIIPPSVQNVVLLAADTPVPSSGVEPSGWVFLGNYYVDDKPSITVGCYSATSPWEPAAAIGATAWQVVDIDKNIVGSGSMLATATSFAVSSSGQWIGGGAMMPGHYTVVTPNGTGTLTISPPTRLPRPVNTGTVENGPPTYAGFTVWFGAPDRDMYNYVGLTAEQIIHNLGIDQFYTGAQDPARPHYVWIAPAPQSPPSSPAPTAAQWGSLAAALVAAGYPGAWYELFTNEPENGGWNCAAGGNMTPYWQECAAAVVAADPTAHCMGWVSGGIFNNSPLSSVAAFLAAISKGVETGGPQISGFTNHMENSNQNMSNLVGLRQYFGALKEQFVASGYPNLTYWNTESGIEGGLYGVLQPRREARQRTMLRFVAESFGWPHEQQYDFAYLCRSGSGLPMYIIDGTTGGYTGTVRAGGYAVHVMHEALVGTTCTPESPPAALDFGPVRSPGWALLMGSHYSGTENDVVVLATNGIESPLCGGTVTLDVSATGSVVCWDGMGRETTLPVVNGQITVPLDDLLTYVLLPTGSTVSVAPAWWSGAVIGSFGNFAANNSGVTGVPAPYESSTVPGSISVTTTEAGAGFALLTSGPAWQGSGCSITKMQLAVGGDVIWSYECESAETLQVPAATNTGSADPCPYTTWWTGPFGWLVEVPIPAGEVTLTIEATGYGGQADELGSTSPLNSYHEGDSMKIEIAGFEVLA